MQKLNFQETPEQIIEELSFTLETNPLMTLKGCENNQKSIVSGLTKNEAKLLKCVQRHPTNIDTIVNRSGMQMALVLSVLFSLELKNVVIASADGYFKKQTG